CEVGSWTYWIYVYFFFFPAEDGIRDFHVTGVQTCALPISMPVELRARSFDHFLLNPPFHAAGTVTSAGDAGRRTALAEGAAGLGVWLDAALRRARAGGTVTVIHRAERLDDILAALAGRAGDIRILPLQGRSGRPAGRVIVQARKGRRSPLQLLPALVLHTG